MEFLTSLIAAIIQKVVTSLVQVWMNIRQGKLEARADAGEEAILERKAAEAKKNEVHNLSDADIAAGLRKWTRPD